MEEIGGAFLDDLIVEEREKPELFLAEVMYLYRLLNVVPCQLRDYITF